MSSSIASALLYGYTPRTLLRSIGRQIPQAAGFINAAQIASYSADQILSRVMGGKSSDPYEVFTDAAMRAKRNGQLKKEMAVLGGTAAALAVSGLTAAGLYNYFANRAIQPAVQQAIRPNQILPALGAQQVQGQQPTTLHGRRRPQPPSHQLTNQQGMLPNQQGQLPYNPSNPPEDGNPPSGGTPRPTGRALQLPYNPSTPPKPLNADQSVNLIKNMGREAQIENALRSTKDVKEASQLFRSLLSQSKADREKVKLLDQVEGGLEKVVSDYSQHLSSQPKTQAPVKPQQPPQPPIEQPQQPPVVAHPKDMNIQMENIQSQHPDQNLESFTEKGIETKKVKKLPFKIQESESKEEPGLHLMKSLDDEGKAISVVKYNIEKDKIIIDSIQASSRGSAIKALSLINSLNNLFERYPDKKVELTPLTENGANFLNKILRTDFKPTVKYYGMDVSNQPNIKLTDKDKLKFKEYSDRLLGRFKEPEKPSEPIKPPVDFSKTIITPQGVGEISHEGKKGIIANVGGKEKSFFPKDIEKPPENVVEAVIEYLGIPEYQRSSNVAMWMADPNRRELFVQFHNGKFYRYLDVDPDKIQALSEKRSKPRTEGGNVYGAWAPEDTESLGATVFKEIISDPKYKKSVKGEPPNPNYQEIEVGYDFWKPLRKEPKRKKK